LTDEERARSNRERQARWRAKHLGYVRLKEKNRWAAKRNAQPNNNNSVPNAVQQSLEPLPHYGEIHYGAFPDEMEPELGGGRVGQRRARAMGVTIQAGRGFGGDVPEGDRASGGGRGGPGIGTATFGAGSDLRADLPGGPDLGGEDHGKMATTAEERRVDGLVEAFKAKARNRGKGVEVELEL
jgi:hypothetical protein